MGQINNNTNDRKNKHLNYEERIKIEALFRLGLAPIKIGEQVGNHSRLTIER